MGASNATRLVPECRVKVDGRPLELPVDAALVRVEADLDQELFAQCALLFVDARLDLINGQLFSCGAKLNVEIGFHPKLMRVFEGEVVALEPCFVRDKPPSLRVVCLEGLHRLALSRTTRALNNVDDNEIVRKIAQEHGLKGEGPSGTREHVLQANLSDAVFLRRIAQKHGGHVRVEGSKLILGPPPNHDEILVTPRDGVRKIRLHLKANQQVGEVTVHGWDPKARREIVGRARPQGDEGEGARQHGGTASIALAGHESMPADTATAEAMAKARMRRLAERFRTVQLEMVGDARAVPGAVLQLEGFGVPIDARYRLQSAHHAWDRFGYRVELKGVFSGPNKAPRPVQPPGRREDEQAEKFEIEIRLLDPKDRPRVDLAYELTLPDGKKVSSFTGADGLIRATSSKKGDAKLEVFPGRKRPRLAPPRPLPGGALLIELQLVTSAGDPVPDRAWELTLPDGAIRTGRSDEQGFVRARSTSEGQVQLRLPEIDPEPKPPAPKPLPKPRWRIRLCDEAWNPLAKTPCSVFLDAGGLSTQTDGDGFVEIGDDLPHEQARIEWSSPDGGKFVRTVFLDLGKGEEQSRRRLHNVGYAGDEPLESKVRRFEEDFGRKVTGHIAQIQDDLRRWHDGGAKPATGEPPTERAGTEMAIAPGGPVHEAAPTPPPLPQLTAGPEDAPLVPGGLSLEGRRCTLAVLELVGNAKDSARRAEARARLAFRIEERTPFRGKRTTLLRFLLNGDDEGIREQHEDDELTRTGGHVWVQDGYKSDIFDTRRLSPGTTFSASVFAHSQFGGRMGRPPALTMQGRRVADWVDVRADRANRKIEVEVAVRISELDGSLGSLFQFVRRTILRGIGRFWSRTVQLTDGSSWEVITRATEQAVGVEFQCMKQLWEGQRACNTGVVVAGMPVIYPYNPDRSDLDAMDTAAHEFGHSVLRATMGSEFSMRHKGTSTDWQTPRDDASDTPASGEVDLMKYYKRYHRGYQARVVAAQEDVLRLVSLGAVVLES